MNNGILLVKEWIGADGPRRSHALQEAAHFLLEKYFQKWEKLIPVNLHKLAATLRTQIVRTDQLKGDAVLIPLLCGFRILVNSELLMGRYRSSIAHELAHTLFYTNVDGERPRRSLPHSMREEHFCFDVARYVLAPKEHLTSIGAFGQTDPAVLFKRLTETLQLSRPWAARVMLADYKLAEGIAGRWIRGDSGWKQERYSSTATPSLSQPYRRRMRDTAHMYLLSGKSPEGFRIISVKETRGDGIFMVILK